MAFLYGKGGFTGSLGNLSAYQPKGSDKIILRTKGGATKKQIKTHPRFARVRSNNEEFGSCRKMAAQLRSELYPFVNMVDYNLQAAFSALNKTIQLQDIANPPGQRNMLYSQHRYLLANFPLNKRYGFDTVMRYPLQPVFDRALGTVRLVFPNLQPGIHLQFPWQLPYYRLFVKLFMISDLTHTGKNYDYPGLNNMPGGQLYSSSWLPVTAALPGEELFLSLQVIKNNRLSPAATELAETHSLVVAAGIQMGKPGPNETIEEVKYCGTGKILAAG
ncbi:MAG TPA: hypothetical protein VGE25_10965 [Sediminibacterium sp.]